MALSILSLLIQLFLWYQQFHLVAQIGSISVRRSGNSIINSNNFRGISIPDQRERERETLNRTWLRQLLNVPKTQNASQKQKGWVAAQRSSSLLLAGEGERGEERRERDRLELELGKRAERWAKEKGYDMDLFYPYNRQWQWVPVYSRCFLEIFATVRWK